MACTKETYTATADWTAPQLAQLFRDAFIDAGLMTAWFDSFANGGIENRILKVEYDGTKTYGTTYYWFMFSTWGVYLHVATGWNASTDQPTGTQYLDFFATTTNSTTNHATMFSAPSPSNTVELVRYTSGVDANQSWFVIKSGAARFCFTIVNGAMTVQPWMDLAKGFFAGFSWLYPTVGSSIGRRSGALSFMRGPSLRRDLVFGSALNGSTSSSQYAGTLTSSSTSVNKVTIVYAAVGNTPNDYSANSDISDANNVNSPNSLGSRPGAIILPNNFSGTNPAFTSNSNPVFHSMPFMPYITESLPADFGLTFHYATNSFSQGDTFVVSAGTEEWEVLDFAANASAVTGASPLFLARMV